MATYSKVVTVTASAYSTAPDLQIPYVPKVIRACNMNEGDVAYVSFDGVNDAAALLDDVKSPSSVMEWRWQLGQKVWLRSAGGSVDVQIIAEA